MSAIAFALERGLQHIVVPLLWSATITLVSSLLFLGLKWAMGLRFSSGTDLFAVLFAADLAVALGSVEVWLLSQSGAEPWAYRSAAVILALATIGLC